MTNVIGTNSTFLKISVTALLALFVLAVVANVIPINSVLLQFLGGAASITFFVPALILWFKAISTAMQERSFGVLVLLSTFFVFGGLVYWLAKARR